MILEIVCAGLEGSDKTQLEELFVFFEDARPSHLMIPSRILNDLERR